MARAPARRKNTKKKQHSLIPVLFTLGVIGWGFFAIDRLTAPLVDVVEPRVASAKKKSFRSLENNEVTFKQKVLHWVESVLPEDKKPKAVVQQAPAATEPVVKSQLQPQPPEAVKQAPPEKLTSIRLYFYKVSGSSIKLATVSRTGLQGSRLSRIKSTLTQLVRGPNANERKKTFTDSFPNKPGVRSVSEYKGILNVDFDSRFGRGVSFQMLRYQVTQLMRTVLQFKGIKGMSISIGGKPTQTLGGDGLTLPRVINASTWRPSS